MVINIQRIFFQNKSTEFVFVKKWKSFDFVKYYIIVNGTILWAEDQ